MGLWAEWYQIAVVEDEDVVKTMQYLPTTFLFFYQTDFNDWNLDINDEWM